MPKKLVTEKYSALEDMSDLAENLIFRNAQSLKFIDKEQLQLPTFAGFHLF